MPGDNGSLRRRHENGDPSTNGNIGELEAPSLQLDHAHDQTRDPSYATEQGTTEPEHSENFDVDYGAPKGPLKQQIVKFCRKTFTVQNFLNKFPIIKWLPKYRCQDFQGDIIAGLTVGLTVIPQGLAYAQVANLPAQYGLYSAFVGCFVYCILGSAKDITMGPTAILSLMTASFGTANAPVLPSGERDPTMTTVLTLLSGIIELVMGFFKLGILVNFISYPVIYAFTSAAAITIAAGQVKDDGVRKRAEYEPLTTPNDSPARISHNQAATIYLNSTTLLGLKNVPSDFLPMVYETCRKLPETKIWDMTMGLSSLLVLILLKKLRGFKFKSDEHNPLVTWKRVVTKALWLISISANVLVVIATSGVVAILEYHGLKNKISVTGTIKAGMPDFTPPKFAINKGNITMSSTELLTNLGAGLGIVPLLSIIETMAIGKAFARINNYKLDPTQELIAIGSANILSSFVSSYPITGSFSRTAVNSQCGVRTPLGGIWTGGLVILALCVLTPWFYYIPKSALAAVIISAVIQMVEYHVVIQLWKANKLDLIPFFITFVCSLIVGIEYGILIGIGFSILMLLYPTARPRITYLTLSSFLVVTPMQGLYFPACEYLEIQAMERALEEDKIQYIVLDLQHIADVDYTGMNSLRTLANDCQRKKMKLILANGRPHVNKQVKHAEIKNIVLVRTVKTALAHFGHRGTQENSTSVTVTSDITRL